MLMLHGSREHLSDRDRPELVPATRERTAVHPYMILYRVGPGA